MTMIDKGTDRAGEHLSTAPVRRLGPQIVAGGVLVLIGALWLLERLGAIDLTVTTVLAIGTIFVGVALMLLAGDGPHGGLIVFGSILAVVTTATALAPLEGFQGGVGERRIQVSQVADLASEYNLAMGDLTIDLRELTDLDGVTSLAASVGLGQLTIRVAEGTPVSVKASAGAGELQIFDRNANGLGVDQAFESDSFDQRSRGLIIEADVFMGRVEVTNG